jgi:Na+/proline symporter
VVYGALLGVFLLGVLTRRVGEKAAMAGMLAGFLLMLYVRIGTTIAWTWYVLIGSTATFATALAVSTFLKEESHGGTQA